MTTFNPNISGYFPLHANKMPGFFFRKRIERIDWKRLASVDVRKVTSQMDIDVLQENLLSVAFCDIDSEIDTRYADSNLVKLFQLAQLLIEYLLYSQDYLTNTVDSLRREIVNVKKEADLLRKRLDEQAQRLTTTRKECHRRRLLLLAQQRLMNNGPQSYFRCSHCPKAFINSSFLNAHLFRRHAEVVATLQNVDLTKSGLFLQSFENKICQVNEKVPAEEQQATLTTNLEQQIKEVLEHIRTQVPPPSLSSQPPVSSAVVQTSTHSPDAVWKKRAAELERQLKEEREQLRHFGLKEAINPIGYGDLDDDVPLQLERQVKSLEQNVSIYQDSITNIPTSQSIQQIESEDSESLSCTGTYTLPSFKMVNNANKAGVEDSLPTLKMLRMSNESSVRDDVFNLYSEISERSKKQYRTQQTSQSGIHARYKEVCTQVIQTENAPSEVKFDRESQGSSSIVNSKSVTENQELRTENNESDQIAESIHLIPFVIPAFNNKSQTFMEVHIVVFASPKRGRYQPRAENRIVQIVHDDSYSPKNAKERLRQSSSAEKAANIAPEKTEKSLQASEPKIRINPLEGIPHYKDQLKEFLANPSTIRRLRNEVEFILEEQLMDHNVEPNVKGLSRNKFNELTDIFDQERQHLARKFPNFEEIRAVPFHSKREHTSPSPSRGESGSFKRARPSRASERRRPPSGRPSSLTSLTTTLSPIAEHLRGATASPTIPRHSGGANQAQSKQSLFEDSESENEDDDVVKVDENKKDEKEAKIGRKEG
ncbi:unnamed protein product [Hymenolepis diminuta]|uniref:C2H2-type domain-containing protein n=1 Tax=Hymenolepis diminuta TaxID=6216 RepID=A0A0R3SIW5_HYMDI|nr:unnamed protein product [Hymenolepis diminuta]